MRIVFRANRRVFGGTPKHLPSEDNAEPATWCSCLAVSAIAPPLPPASHEPPRLTSALTLSTSAVIDVSPTDICRARLTATQAAANGGPGEGSRAAASSSRKSTPRPGVSTRAKVRGRIVLLVLVVYVLFLRVTSSLCFSLPISGVRVCWWHQQHVLKWDVCPVLRC